MSIDIGRKTGDDAYQRVLLARMGSMGPDATDEYLLQLQFRLHEFIDAIGEELARRTATAKGFELWHKSTAGAVVSQGFMQHFDDEDELREMAHDEYGEVGEGADFELHIVPRGSYNGFAQPDLGPSTLIECPNDGHPPTSTEDDYRTPDDDADQVREPD